MRKAGGLRALERIGAATREYIVDGGDGVRLFGLHSTIPGRAPKALVLLLHGWEGSADSGYMRHTAAHLLERGFDVFRLNFRDHGDTHHLNEGIFHSCRLAEVVHAAKWIADRFPSPAFLAAGYSLGGNFALRLALRAPAAGVPLQRVAAVCPVLDPGRTMQQMEDGLPLYLYYFERKWRRSHIQSIRFSGSRRRRARRRARSTNTASISTRRSTACRSSKRCQRASSPRSATSQTRATTCWTARMST